GGKKGCGFSSPFIAVALRQRLTHHSMFLVPYSRRSHTLRVLRFFQSSNRIPILYQACTDAIPASAGFVCIAAP
ncbi:hypothetical protein, partial [Fischerella sp.]|uniref:hypothetical protein n=1 Tax=Fischerella sp. TaxID=1191 RepID=UPI0025C55F98